MFQNVSRHVFMRTKRLCAEFFIWPKWNSSRSSFVESLLLLYKMLLPKTEHTVFLNRHREISNVVSAAHCVFECCIMVEALDSSTGWVVFLLIQVPHRSICILRAEISLMSDSMCVCVCVYDWCDERILTGFGRRIFHLLVFLWYVRKQNIWLKEKAWRHLTDYFNLFIYCNYNKSSSQSRCLIIFSQML